MMNTCLKIVGANNIALTGLIKVGGGGGGLVETRSEHVLRHTCCFFAMVILFIEIIRYIFKCLLLSYPFID